MSVKVNDFDQSPYTTLKKGVTLDTLAHLDHAATSKGFKGRFLPKPVVTNLLKRAKAKWFTNQLVLNLADIHDSVLRKQYWNSWHCSSVLIQSGQKVTAKYCKNRWCVVCNRIRTAKLIKGYLPIIRSFNDSKFVTLSSITVPEEKLKQEIERKIKVFSLIVLSAKRHKFKPKILRNIEVTYRPETNLYHPHLHFICEDSRLANFILNEWLERNSGLSNRGGQDIKAVNNNALTELFKYAAKIIVGKEIYIRPLDKIYTALRNKRVIEAYGIKKVSDDIDDLVAEEYLELASCDRIWRHFETDWYCTETGDELTGYYPEEELIKVFDRITK